MKSNQILVHGFVAAYPSDKRAYDVVGGSTNSKVAGTRLLKQTVKCLTHRPNVGIQCSGDACVKVA